MIVLVKYDFIHMTKSLMLAGVCCLGLVGCVNDDVSDLEQYIQQVRAKPKGTIPLLPEIKVVEPFLFNPDGLRNPFQAVKRVEEDELTGPSSVFGIRPNVSRRKEELEDYSLDTLRMVGTVKMENGKWALIKANDGTIHRVQKGNYMGRNYGEIIQILDNRIEMMEIVPDKPGAWREQQASLALSE